MSRNCNNCGAPLRDGAKFCKKCGRPVVDEVTNEKEANQIPNHTQEAPVIVEKGKKGSGGCFPTILKAVIGIVILFFAAAALFGKSDDKSTKVEKTPDSAESALASFEITGKISSSTFSKGSDGFMANVDNKVYVVDLKNNQAARVENFSYILNDLRNQQNAGNSTGRIIPQFLIFNDKHGKDDDKGEWRNNNHFLPVFVPIKVDGAGNIKSEGRMSSGKGAAPSHYQGFLEEQKNVDLVNLFLKDISSFMDSSDTAIVPNPSPVYIGVINANEVNVRTGPGKEFKSLGVFFKGDKVRLVGERGNNIGEFWYQIEYDNPSAGLIKGWVRKDFINFDKPVEPKDIVESKDNNNISDDGNVMKMKSFTDSELGVSFIYPENIPVEINGSGLNREGRIKFTDKCFISIFQENASRNSLEAIIHNEKRMISNYKDAIVREIPNNGYELRYYLQNTYRVDKVYLVGTKTKHMRFYYTGEESKEIMEMANKIQESFKAK